MASHIVERSPSARRAPSSVSPNLPAEEEELEEKPVCIIAAVFDRSSPRRYDWYAFDITNDPKHNQVPPPPLNFIPPPGFSRYYRKIPDHLLPFHEQDDDHHASVNLQAVAATSCSDNLQAVATSRSDEDAGWAVLGSTSTTSSQPDVLYHICGTGNPYYVEDPGACVERIELSKYLSGGSDGGHGGGWVSVAKTPSPIGTAGCLALLGKLYCLGTHTYTGGRAAPWPWAMAYDPGLDKWEPLPDPPCRPEDLPTFTAAIDAGQLGPAIAVASKGLIQIYHVNKRSWGLEPFDSDHTLSRPASDPIGQAVAVENMLYWYVLSEQCLVGYDLVTRNWFRGHLCMHDSDGYTYSREDNPPSLTHLGRDGVDINKFCLSWVSLFSTRLDMKELVFISRLHCLKVCVFITNKIISETGTFLLDVSIITCQSYLVDGSKAFRGAMLVNGNQGDKTLLQLMN